MFIIGNERVSCERALRRFRAAAAGHAFGDAHSFQLDAGTWLSWMSAAPTDALTEYADGFLIGTATPGVGASTTPARCASAPLPPSHPLATAFVLRRAGDGWHLAPHHLSGAYTDGTYVSDRQLLIADAAGHVPDPVRVGVLAHVGYLPGNLTLFREIARVPFLGTLRLADRRVMRDGAILRRDPDDGRMVARLRSVVPVHGRHALGMSAGADSRFVLGVLHSAGVRPALYHLTGGETENVAALAAETGLSLTTVDSATPPVAPYLYTLMTDAQLYYRGGQYGKLRDVVAPDGVYHTGLFADSILKLAFRTAWKVPDPRRSLYERLVDYALLSILGEQDPGLRVGRADVRRLLLEELAFGEEYETWATPQEAANWFYYLHRGVRWSQATTADLAHFTCVVHLLSDVEALSHGISAPYRENAGKSRVKSLCADLLPDVSTGYGDGAAPTSTLGRLQYEFVDRIGARLAAYFRPRAPGATLQPAVAGITAPGFDRYFRGSPDVVTGDASPSHRHVRRAAVTVAHVLRYLGER